MGAVSSNAACDPYPGRLIFTTEAPPTLDALRPTERFSNRAEAYRLYRPGYPDAVLELIRRNATFSPETTVADVGSGTGILTRMLLQAGYKVWGVEPNAAMRRAAEENLAGFADFTSVDATAEATGLPGGFFCAITVAQAFHWFDPIAARREFQRLLQAGGWVFILRNERSSGSSPFAHAYEALLQDLGENYRAVRHRDQEASSERLREFFPGSIQTESFHNPQILDWAGLKGRFLSSSYVPAEGEPRHREFMARLEEIYHRHAQNGKVTLDQQTEVNFGTL